MKVINNESILSVRVNRKGKVGWLIGWLVGRLGVSPFVGALKLESVAGSLPSAGRPSPWMLYVPVANQRTMKI